MIMKKKRSIFILSFLLAAVWMSADPIVRVVSSNGSDQAFAMENVHKLVLSADTVDIVNNEGSVLLSVPFAEIARVEFGEGTPTAIPNTTIVRDEETVKVYENGQVYILRSGKKYTIMGVEVVERTK